ncbi:MCE family protein [Pseudonocardia sp. CA-107938]|uniref:MCE family protein n=1 Tax=Pseudonocardia sp. CA-107938 TaxID=3240021 RepID=UPI003D925E83
MRRIAIAALALLTSGCGLSFQNLPVGRAPAGESYPIVAEFSDASNLPVGGIVRLGQSAVGRVESIDVAGFTAVVRVNIAADVQIPAGTTARLQLPSPLGEEYLLLRPPDRPAPGVLGPGAVIALTDTSRGPDIENLFAALGGLLSGSGLQQVSTIVEETNKALDGRADEVRGLLDRLSTVLAALQKHRDRITNTLDVVDRLTTYTRANQASIDAALTDIAPGIQALLSQRETFDELVHRLTPLADAVQGVVGPTRGELKRLAANLGPPLDALAAMNDRLDRVLANVAALGPNISGLIPGDYITADGHLDVPALVTRLLEQLATDGPKKLLNPGGPEQLLGAADD